MKLRAVHGQGTDFDLRDCARDLAASGLQPSGVLGHHDAGLSYFDVQRYRQIERSADCGRHGPQRIDESRAP